MVQDIVVRGEDDLSVLNDETDLVQPAVVDVVLAVEDVTYEEGSEVDWRRLEGQSDFSTNGSS